LALPLRTLESTFGAIFCTELLFCGCAHTSAAHATTAASAAESPHLFDTEASCGELPTDCDE
jgi:hypothetical protein